MNDTLETKKPKRRPIRQKLDDFRVEDPEKAMDRFSLALKKSLKAPKK